MASNNTKHIANHDEVWDEVKQMDLGKIAPTNEHDGQTVRGLIDLMKQPGGP